MNSIVDIKELCAACKARNYDPINLSGLAYILKVCQIKKKPIKGKNIWEYELTYRGLRAYGINAHSTKKRKK